MTRLVRAGNPGPMTLEGTNTWLVGTARVLVVDPGPDDEAHVRAVLAEAARDGGVLGGVLLTHRHPDHADALASPVLRAALDRAGAPVLAVDRALGSPPEPAALAAATDEGVRLVRLPGHTDDSVGLVVPARREVLTGDTVLGRGTSVVAHPDGDLGDYLASLDALLGVLHDGADDRADDGADDGVDVPSTGPVPVPWRGLPGHGPVLDDLAVAVRALGAHRAGRVEQVQAALASLAEPVDRADRAQRGVPDPDDAALVGAVVAAVYPDVTDPVLREAAARTVRATLVHLGRGAAA